MSTTLNTSSPIPPLPWSRTPEEDRQFRRILLVSLFLFLIVGLTVPWLPVMQPEPDEVADEPRPIESLVLAPREEQPEPAVTPPEERAEPEPQPQPPTVAEETPAEPAEPEPAPAPAEPSARERAEDSGLLALRDRLDNMRGSAPSASLGEDELSGEGAEASERERRLATADVEEGSGGIDSSAVTQETGGSDELAGRTTAQVDSPVGERGGERAGRTRDHQRTRTDEEIQLVFDRNKSGFYALYNRALREDPTLQGKLVVRLTIAPSGEVTAAEVVSSELQDSELEQRLLARIRQLDFGAKDVEQISINYPIDFFPS
ncbi:hypothetical protein CAI21_02875 [Alkalilimnicola ehrlichii]|uniref:TonB family protein n=1 Tax=Alkalilimnicola ehrlichii TaxID=351052 RepID=A0A3E0X3I8_9GAMM|nr:AgmX/PglI C-terminal domain-containing protein [Alkalilimnicola ehrlichii]RFA30937.1 hypothetical protein CAI21_02875 [Alkalilimnicola ehrlichii]RFA38887.1 hypothetical protein CAL65_03010 [Alkalilimnicola ehrlichii]